MNKKQITQFGRFRKDLYKGDALYVGTAEFILEMLLKKTTAFARSCEIEPVVFEKEGRRSAQALWIKAKDDDFAQVAFFDCERGEKEAANQIVDDCVRLTKERGLRRLVIGLNGHLSYGVGLLTQTDLKNSFDTCYNKMYYSDFFRNIPDKKYLTAYRCPLSEASERMDKSGIQTDGYDVRTANFKKFEAECEIMRRLCDETIGQTYLYSPTRKGHFFDLLKDMKIILNEENLLFLMYEGREVGFLFWHPDFNCTLKAGKAISALNLACGAVFGRKKIDTVKLNSIGVEDEHRGRGTLALLRALRERAGGKYKFIETNFVWDENRRSRLLNLRLLCGECRKFEVYEVRIL